MESNFTEVLTMTDNSTMSMPGVPESLETTRYIVQKILVPFVAAIGLLGNSLNVFVLRHPFMKGISTNFYLFILCLADIFYLILSLSLSFKHCSDTDQHISAFYFIVYARPLTDLSGNIAVWITVAFTIERYIGVRLPMKGKIWCTVRKAKIVSFVIFIFCLVNTFPEFFEMEIITNQHGHLRCEYTTFAQHSNYQIGYYWWFVTIFTFVPFSCLFLFNGLLIRSLLEAKKCRKLLLKWESKQASLKYKREQHKVTLMLITIVIIFLLCQLPWTILLLYRTYLSERDLQEPINDIRIAGNVCNLLVQLNASVNFYLYSFFSKKFRKTLKRIFCVWKFDTEPTSIV
ncbi:FMRFamide peptide receptor frpr-18 [Patella vulgata]|uniref:FMRFamide peptide receptor frpr-18 n=1 Tax=Patella vulgata TaxID=6465 RepID=UPI0024A86C6F|nr:FMRFamide peptide receptor frpr-18 [Patella vulgata]